MQALGQIPPLHQPTTDVRMIDLQALLFVLGERAVVALQTFPFCVHIGHRFVQRQHADVLEQCSEEYFFGQRMMHGVAERTCRGCRQQGAAPIQGIAQAVRFAGPQRFDEGETQGEGQRRVQSQHHQRLPQVLALSALRVQG